MKVMGNDTPAVAAYTLETFQPEDAILKEIRERAAAAELPDIHVGPMDSLHLEVITRAINAKKVVEIGTLAGLSGVCLARGLAPGGMLHTFEFEPKHAASRVNLSNVPDLPIAFAHVGAAL